MDFPSHHQYGTPRGQPAGAPNPFPTMPGMAGAMASGDPMGALYGLGARPPLSVRDMDSASTLLANPVLRKSIMMSFGLPPSAPGPMPGPMPGWPMPGAGLGLPPLPALPSLPSLPPVSAPAAAPAAPSRSRKRSPVESEGSDSDRPRPSGRKGAADTSASQAERIARMQEKNRRAQRRFRERQKQKVSGLETQVDDLGRQNELLRVQLQGLQVRQSTTTRMLDLLEAECKAWADGDATKAKELHRHITVLQSNAGDIGAVPLHTGEPIKVEGAVKSWKTYVEEARQVLAEVEALPPEARVVEDTPPTSGPLARAEHTREVLSSIPLKLATQDQVSVKRFSVTNFETGAEVVLMDALRQEELWADRIDRLGLTDEQLVLAVKFRDLYLQKLNEIHKERQMIQTQIFNAQPEGFKGTVYLQMYSLRIHALITKLQENFSRESQVNFAFMGNCRKAVFTAVQYLRLVVEAYPTYPDLLALTNIIYKRVNDSASLKKLFHDAQGWPLPVDVMFPHFEV